MVDASIGPRDGDLGAVTPLDLDWYFHGGAGYPSLKWPRESADGI